MVWSSQGHLSFEAAERPWGKVSVMGPWTGVGAVEGETRDLTFGPVGKSLISCVILGKICPPRASVYPSVE